MLAQATLSLAEGRPRHLALFGLRRIGKMRLLMEHLTRLVAQAPNGAVRPTNSGGWFFRQGRQTEAGEVFEWLCQAKREPFDGRKGGHSVYHALGANNFLPDAASPAGRSSDPTAWSDW